MQPCRFSRHKVQQGAAACAGGAHVLEPRQGVELETGSGAAWVAGIQEIGCREWGAIKEGVGWACAT